MERQSKEDSLALWEFEKNNVKQFGSKISEELKELMEVADKKINNYSLTYNEFMDDILEGLAKLKDTDSIETRQLQIKGLYNCLTNKYMKMENDGKKYDCGKVRMDLIPLDVVENIGKVLTYGAQKYSDNSWQNLPDFWKRYKAALLRHLTAIDKGELIDPESGLPHIDHVLCNTVFLDWGFHHGKAISINTKDIEQDE